MHRTQVIESFAQKLLAGEITPAQLSRVVADARLSNLPARACDEINSEVNNAPHRAYALAYIVREIARHGADARQRAHAELLYVRTLNALGEFREAASHGADAAHAFVELQELETAARAWLETAWAETWLGNLEEAREHLDRAAGLLPPGANVLLQARADWIAGRMLHDQGEYAQALQLLERAREAFQTAGETLDAARCQREVGYCRYLSSDPVQALPVLEEARRIFEAANCPTEAALCENFLGQAHRLLNQFRQACASLLSARKTFSENEMHFFAAMCDLDLGFVEWQLNHYDAALVLLQEARDYFLGCGADSQASSCEVNIGAVLSLQNRYEEAIPHLHQAAAQALASGRRKKAALSFMNLGWAADQQGNYAQALIYYQRARDEFTQGGSPMRIAVCECNLGLTLFKLGQTQEALAALERAREICTLHDLRSDLAECEVYRGQVLLALARTAEGMEALWRARALFEEAQQEAYVALCDRVLASVGQLDKREALARLERSQQVFNEHGQPIDAALCDLTRGELHLSWHEWKKAANCLLGARRRLYPGFPDQAWRVDYGLGRVAASQKKRKAALQHYLSAVQSIANLRAGLGLERLSNDLFGTRQQVFSDALRLARGAREDVNGLTVIEAAKAQTFLSYLMKPDWRTPSAPSDLGARTDLSQRERQLRYQLAALRRRVSLHAAQAQGEPLRDAGMLGMVSAETLKELNALSEAYETVVARLRLTRGGLAGVPSLAPFSLDAFREVARARWGEQWAALDYYLADGICTVAYLDPKTITLESIALSDYDQFVLQQCTSIQADLRELVYRGTIRGSPAPASGTKYLQYLTAKLIPARLRASSADLTLIISPHGVLHQLPFHALVDGDGYLLDHFTFVYTPSLQALTQLNDHSNPGAESERVLLCGLDEFGSRARPLPNAGREIEGLKDSMNERGAVLWKTDATRRMILDWNESRMLEGFDLLHFATHAVAEPRAPHWSRILLADDDLTVLDIMDLNLDARLVTLSACSTALGERGRGDELIGFAHAFFYAGTRALLASLWAVEDESTAQLMMHFYRNLKHGNSIARALREVQLEMRRAGFLPYHWAPFVAIGNA